MENRDLIRDAMMFAVKDITGRILREATVRSMIDDFEKQLTIPDVVGRSEQLESGLTCMMCRKPKDNDGHTCCEECAGLAF